MLQLQDFIAAVRTGSRPMVSADSAIASLRILAALYGNRQPLADDWDVQMPAIEVTS